MLRVHPVVGNRQRLDGGAMFGNAPRALWSRWLAPDEAGRVELACRAVLVEDGERRVLLETGIGAFFEPKLRERFGVFEPEHVLLGSLQKLGLTDADIDVVVLSHLHFDHAGGLFPAYIAGAERTLLFPKATFVVGQTAFERASHPHSRDRGSFIEGLPGLLSATGRLEVVPVGARTTPALGERFSLSETQGHTPGLLHVTVHGAAASILYVSDLAPGVPWLHVPITMGYDRFPEALVDEKAAVLGEAARAGTWLALVHDPAVAFARVAADDRGSFRATETRTDAAGGWDLDRAD